MSDERLERPRKPILCPKCNSRSVARIVYGLPFFNEQESADVDAGKIVLGGCIITGDDPAWQCVSCGQDIYRAQK